MMDQAIFYLLAAVTLLGSLLAVREKHPVHAIIYLVTSLFSVAIIFFLLLAPLVAAFEVILYAGAIMVLFLFVIMMLDLGHPEKAVTPDTKSWLPALLLTGTSSAALIWLVVTRTGRPAGTTALTITDLAQRLFRSHGLAVELISLQLLFALVGALYLGKQPAAPAAEPLNGKQQDDISP